MCFTRTRSPVRSRAETEFFYNLFFFFIEVYTFLFSQVAHFYNTIDRQMIPSQQAMMLEAALAFEHIIKNPKAGVKNGNEVRLLAFLHSR